MCWAGAWHELFIDSFVIDVAVAGQQNRYNKMQGVMTWEDTFCEGHPLQRVWEYAGIEEFRPPTLQYVAVACARWSLFWNASLYSILLRKSSHDITFYSCYQLQGSESFPMMMIKIQNSPMTFPDGHFLLIIKYSENAVNMSMLKKNAVNVGSSWIWEGCCPALDDPIHYT